MDYFKEHSDLTIHIVGAVERDFIKAYCGTFPSNIIFHGFMNVASVDFKNIASVCNFLIYPSCTEGGVPGSVITCMYYGIIPIVSQWAAFDEIEEMGYLLTNLDIDAIQLVIDRIIDLSDDEVKRLSVKCSIFSQNTYNLRIFEKEFKQYIKTHGG